MDRKIIQYDMGNLFTIYCQIRIAMGVHIYASPGTRKYWQFVFKHNIQTERARKTMTHTAESKDTCQKQKCVAMG